MIRMNKHFTVVALAISLAFSANVMAQNMSKNDDKISTEKIATVVREEAEYAVAKERCDDLAASAKKNCIAQAKVNFAKA